jgi:hypothetical protein
MATAGNESDKRGLLYGIYRRISVHPEKINPH